MTVEDQAEQLELARRRLQVLKAVMTALDRRDEVSAAISAAADSMTAAEKVMELLDTDDPGGPGARAVLDLLLSAFGRTRSQHARDDLEDMRRTVAALEQPRPSWAQTPAPAVLTIIGLSDQSRRDGHLAACRMCLQLGTELAGRSVAPRYQSRRLQCRIETRKEQCRVRPRRHARRRAPQHDRPAQGEPNSLSPGLEPLAACWSRRLGAIR